MTGGARHGIGAGIGIVGTPVLMALLIFGSERLLMQWRYTAVYFRGEFATGTGLLGGLLILLLAAGVAALVTTRVSPVASLIPGAVFTLYGLLWMLLPGRAIRIELPLLSREYGLVVAQVGGMGILLLIGVILVAGSAVPSRWRAAAASGPGRLAQPHGPAFAAPGQPAPYGAQSAPYGGQSAPYGGQPGPWGQGPQQPWQQPQPGQPQPQYGQAQPQFGSAPPPGGAQRSDQQEIPAPPTSGKDEGTAPRSGSTPGDDDEPGEWTRAYGGGDDRPPPPA
ncbi:hypothetical protein ABZ801_13120 [Actinomadura sp. NPDC047616]|uniref:hypothetical protein n=1 Tax=Actinomadura sp. NPDC047616 TaxID=3155914 RepID=UPI0033EA2D60